MSASERLAAIGFMAPDVSAATTLSGANAASCSWMGARPTAGSWQLAQAVFKTVSPRVRSLVQPEEGVSLIVESITGTIVGGSGGNGRREACFQEEVSYAK